MIPHDYVAGGRIDPQQPGTVIRDPDSLGMVQRAQPRATTGGSASGDQFFQTPEQLFAGLPKQPLKDPAQLAAERLAAASSPPPVAPRPAAAAPVQRESPAAATEEEILTKLKIPQVQVDFHYPIENGVTVVSAYYHRVLVGEKVVQIEFDRRCRVTPQHRPTPMSPSISIEIHGQNSKRLSVISGGFSLFDPDRDCDVTFLIIDPKARKVRPEIQDRQEVDDDGDGSGEDGLDIFDDLGGTGQNG